MNNDKVYDQTDLDGEVYSLLGPGDARRMEDTLRYVIADATSILDVGCSGGDWLDLVLRKRSGIREHLGVDVSERRIAEVKRKYPNINCRQGFAEDLDIPNSSFDVVTCLQVLEHIEDWQAVFRSLFVFASQQVLVTVPYMEVIRHTCCIHCAKLTPVSGHLRSYSRETFPEVPGWHLSTYPLRNRAPLLKLPVRIYQILYRRYSWLLASYRRSDSQ